MKYVVFSHRVVIENDMVKTYGIVVVNKFVPVRVMKDISTNYKTVHKLAKKLNKGKVDLVHIDDVIEDFFFENV